MTAHPDHDGDGRCSDRAETAGAARGRGRLALLTLAFAAAYVVAVWFGRTTRIEGSSLALVWPAAAVGAWWVAATWSRPRWRLIGAVGVVVLAGVLSHQTGAPGPLAAVLGLNSGLQAVVPCLVLHHLQRRSGHGLWRLRRTADLGVLLVASAAGALVAGVVGGVTVHLVTGAPVHPAVMPWVLRVGSSTFVLSPLALRVVDRGLPNPLRGARDVWEVAGVGVTVLVAYEFVFTSPDHLPVAFLLVPLAVWVALRFQTSVVSGHGLIVSLVVVPATLHGLGPFALAPPPTRAMLAQAFVCVVTLVALLVALHRDERRQLVDQALAESHRADGQSALLTRVLATMEEGVALIDSSRQLLVRNPAAGLLLGGSASTDGRVRDPAAYQLHTPAGVPCTREQMADVRALAGEQVVQDYLLRPGSDDERVLAVTATPLSTAGGDLQALLVFSDVTEVRRATAEVTRTRDLLAGVLDAATDFAILSTDLEGRIIVFSVGAERLLGYTAQEVRGETPARFHVLEEFVARAAEMGVAPSLDVLIGSASRGVLDARRWTWVRRDGTHLQVSLSIAPIHDDAGTLTGYMGVARDITAEVAGQAELAASEQRFRLAFDTAPVGMMLVGLVGDAVARILRVNATLAAFTGRGEAELLSLDVHALSHPDERTTSRAAFAPFLDGSLTEAKVERRFAHHDGSTRWGLLSASVVHPGGGLAPYLLCLIEDITARKDAEAALTHLALHDALTGLPNRTLLHDRLQHALVAIERSARRVGLLFLDLDGFKAVNDTAGHAAGDELLRQVSARIGHCIRPGDTLARLGGDEFALVCPDVDSGDDGGDDGGARAEAVLEAVAHRILTALRVPVVLPAGTFTISASIGVSTASSGTDPAAALHAADQAMYDAKRSGKDTVRCRRGDEPGGLLAVAPGPLAR